MTDLVQKLVGALEECLDDSRSVLADMEQKYGTNYRQDRLESQRKTIADAEAALSDAKDGGWLPIETCPRDFGGTKFDVWANGQRYADCWWGKATYERGECGIVYQSDYDCNGPVDSYVKGATAWQPLPNPPKEQNT